MIRVSRAVGVHFCVAVCCLSLFQMEGEQMRQGDTEMNAETAATFMGDLGATFLSSGRVTGQGPYWNVSRVTRNLWHLEEKLLWKVSGHEYRNWQRFKKFPFSFIGDLNFSSHHVTPLHFLLLSVKKPLSCLHVFRASCLALLHPSFSSFCLYQTWLIDPLNLALLSPPDLLSARTKTTSWSGGKTKGQFASN